MAIETIGSDTARWRELDARHHLHPFTDQAALAAKGVRVITRAEGCWLWDSEGNRILDGMSGLWCVNVGYGRAELVEAARRQMATLPFYNTFFQCTTAPAVELAARLAAIAPRVRPRVLRQLRLRGQRHRGQAGPVFLEAAGPAAEADHDRAHLRLPRRDARRGEPVRPAQHAPAVRPAAAGLRARACPLLVRRRRRAHARRNTGSRRRRPWSRRSWSSGRRRSARSSASRCRARAA